MQHLQTSSLLTVKTLLQTHKEEESLMDCYARESVFLQCISKMEAREEKCVVWQFSIVTADNQVIHITTNSCVILMILWILVFKEEGNSTLVAQ